MSTILIAGGSGMIGTALAETLTGKGHQVIILSRSSKPSNNSQVTYARWDPAAGTIDRSAIEKADFIVQLAGASVAGKRWSNARKKEILTSRTQAGATIVKALSDISNNVQAVISASAIGWYGDDKKLVEKSFTEGMPADDEFLGDTCRQWEESIRPVEKPGKRLVIFRIGIVLSTKGGALAEFMKPIKMGIAGILGSGKQVISWIHIDDLCRLFVYAIENPKLSGIFNATAPEPVTNRELTLELASRMRGRFFVSMYVPAFVIKMMLGGMSVEVLKSTTVSSEKIRSTGFQFLFPSIEAAFEDLLKKA